MTIPGGNYHVTGAVNALDCGYGRGRTTGSVATMIGGPSNNNIKVVGRFAKAGRQ